MKSKIISLILAGSMILSLGACAKKDPVDGSSESTVATETTAKKETTSKKETTETSEPIPETSPTPTVPSVSETEPTEAPTYGPQEYSFTKINYPVIDGSTSTKPMAAALTSIMLGIPRSEADEMLNFHKTSSSFSYLVEGHADLLICAEPADSVFDMMKENHFDYEMEPFAAEALVFVVNASNPVDSLTIEQIQKIYTGEIKNWKEVGGEDKEIVPVQRNETAGSQVMMEKLVMKDLQMMEAPKELMPEEMGGLIEVVKSYDNSAGAIGYTPYYYATNMKMADGLKIIKVGGVEPNKETIAKGEYPFRTSYYVVISKMIPEGWAPRVLYNWILSEEGQKLAELEGYVPAAEKKEMDTVVNVNWNYYQPAIVGDPVFTRLKEGDMGDFTPSSKYGQVFVFPCIYKDSYYADWTDISYGIFDKNGTLLCDPVFDFGYMHTDGIYVVGKYDGGTGLLSADGSLYTGMKYDGYHYFPETDRFALYNKSNTNLDIYYFDRENGVSTDPIKVKIPDGYDMEDFSPTISEVIDDRYIIISFGYTTDGFLYDIKTGELQQIPNYPHCYQRVGKNMVIYSDGYSDLYCQNVFGKKLSEYVYEDHQILSTGDILLKRKDKTGWDLLDEDGNIRTIFEDPPTEYVSLLALTDYIILKRSDRIELLDLDFQTVSSVKEANALRYGSIDFETPIVSCSLDFGKTSILNLLNGKKTEIESYSSMYIESDYLFVIEYQDNGPKKWTVLNVEDLTMVCSGEGEVDILKDAKDHKYYLACSSSGDQDDIIVMDPASGEVIFKDLPNPRMDEVQVECIYDGKLIYNTYARLPYDNRRISSTTMIDREGNILFLYNTLYLPED